ncbi:hypothetical protein H4R99_006488 [Coemansia sp. RSA 1722]|nr:hypothetical protein IWW45_001649 [Coemansia sp. RSA 485]KAJ2592196.1 hypothetical protein H4R99_006488 [Coemansia sp. RSA 1722]
MPPPPVTFNIDSSEANDCPNNWQRGREERIQRLEAVLEATTRARQQKQQQGIGASAEAETGADAAAQYGDMLDSEDEYAGTYRNTGHHSNGRRNSSSASSSSASSTSASSNEDARSETSSVFYSEGQPLLCTYYQPPPNPTTAAGAGGAAGSAVFGGYGSITASNPPPKTPEQYLPWSVRLLDTLHGIGPNPWSLCGGCCCRCNNSAHSVR